jgi:hypothetical protein
VLNCSIGGKSVAVLGCESGWLETILFDCGAREVTRIEGRRMKTRMVGEQVFTRLAFAEAFLDRPIRFDLVVSMASQEHCGLNGCGEALEALEARGSVDASEEVFCMLRPGGYLLISIVYGRESGIVLDSWKKCKSSAERMELFGAGYRQIQIFGHPLAGKRGTLVLQKPADSRWTVRCPTRWDQTL